ncbi:hypothetical protein [Lentzea sp. CA-135723]|uniref:hypothetical protein n=1 Tax=Lentzea sp. CA-135723 TaxID=3239950 RepID=UPI003D8C4221
MTITNVDSRASRLTGKRTAQEMEQATRCWTAARALLDEAKDAQVTRAAHCSAVANGWLALAELVLSYGVPQGGDVEACDKQLVKAAAEDEFFSSALREKALESARAYRRAARIAAQIAAAQPA